MFTFACITSALSFVFLALAVIETERSRHKRVSFRFHVLSLVCIYLSLGAIATHVAIAWAS